ncbi:unnamed protein product, partial [Amoebophrya sp. A25]|eukprot:GSA25T00024606001.1
MSLRRGDQIRKLEERHQRREAREASRREMSVEASTTGRRRSKDDEDESSATSPDQKSEASIEPTSAMTRRKGFRPAKRRKVLRIERYLDDMSELERLCLADPVNLIKAHIERVTYKLHNGGDPRFDLEMKDRPQNRSDDLEELLGLDKKIEEQEGASPLPKGRIRPLRVDEDESAADLA